jgi:5-methyltetrahydropteroyltriglutamate--homocysteine methyltransferase
MSHVIARSDVVGSLLRPPALVAARKAREAGSIGPGELKKVEDSAVDAAVAMQEAAGLDVVTDGEFRRYAFYGHLIDSVDGFDRTGGWAIPFRDESGEELVLRRPVVVEKLHWQRSLCGEEWTYLRARAKKTGKVTLLSAQQTAAYYDPEKSKGAYKTRDE